MAKGHAEIQKEVKERFEYFGYTVVENKKGKQSKYYNSGKKGISDLLVIKPFYNIIWVEIKTKNDKQKKDQIDFQNEVEQDGQKYYLVYDFTKVFEIVKESIEEKAEKNGR